MSANPPLELRNLAFEIDESVPRHWHGGRRSITRFFDNLSLFFPAGERFFVASVKRYRNRVGTPQLREDVRGFCAQEGAHRREHARYNEWLARQGLPVAAMVERVERLLAGAELGLSRRRRLAVTCALEHFTALMADKLLSDDRLLEGADPVMAALWRWHAAEENEHKAVAFDVFVDAGGTYRERCLAMLSATVIFWAKVLEHQIRLMHADGDLYSAREWRALLTFLFVRPGGLRRLVGPYLAYFRPGFHPWDHDNRELLDAWRAEYATSDVYRRSA